MNTLLLGLLLTSFAADASPSAADVRASHPALADKIDDLQPKKNRAGKYYFPGHHLTAPEAQVLLVDRLLSGRDAVAVQVALAYALDGDHRLPWSTIKRQPADVRAALLAGYKRHGKADAVEALSGGLEDDSEAVRFEAARLLGHRPDLKSERLVKGLKRGLSAETIDLRWASVRALSWRGDPGSFDAIKPLLADPDAKVRGAAVRALGVLDKARAKALPEVAALANDPNRHVQRAFRSLRRD